MNRFTFLSALLLTAASWMPALVSAVPDRFGTLSNTFYILHPASITTSQLTTTATTPSKTVLNGYSSVAKSRLASYSALTGKAVQYGNYKIVSVVQKACPVSVPPTGYRISAITSLVRRTSITRLPSFPPRQCWVPPLTFNLRSTRAEISIVPSKPTIPQLLLAAGPVAPVQESHPQKHPPMHPVSRRPRLPTPLALRTRLAF